MALSLVLGPKQKRLKRPRLGVFAQGSYPADVGGVVSGWSSQLLDHVWQEPVGQNLLLRPRCLNDAWTTTFTGDYARLGFADFGLTAGTGGWHVGGINQARLANDRGTSAAIVSTGTFGPDRGFYVSYFAFDAGTGDEVDLEVGYGVSGSATDAACRLALQFYKGGTVNVNRDGKPAGQGSVGSRLRGFQEIVILPMNLREVLVYSLTNAEGFIFVCDEVTEDTPQPRIVPDTHFWFYKPQGAVDVEIAPMRMATAGSAISTKGAFASLPGANGQTETAEGAEAFRRTDQGGAVTATLVDIAGNAYVVGGAAADPNPDLKNGCRLKVSLTGPGTYSPTVQGAVAGFSAVVKETKPSTLAPSDDGDDAGLSDTGNGIEVRERALSVTLSVPESCSDVRVAFSALGRSVGVDDALWDLCRLTNLPLEATLGGLVPFFRGQSLPSPFSDAPTDRAQGLSAEFNDEWGLFSNVRYRDPYPFDALTLTQALQRAIKHARGTDALFDIEDNSFQIPLVEGAALGQWAEIARNMDASADVIRHMLETYAATWAYGYFPGGDGPIFRAGSLEGHFGTMPKVTLYASIADAITIGGHDPDPNAGDAAWRFVYKHFRETRMRVEANDVRVTGFDPRTRKPIQAVYTDADSADPETEPDARPDNWEGEWLPVTVLDPRITTQAAANRACGILAPRLVNRRVVCSFESELLVSGGMPLWRTDVVELYGKGIYRLNSLDARWLVSEPDGRAWGNPRRRCAASYTAAKGAGAALGNSATIHGLDHVVGAHERNLAERTRVRPGGEALLGLPIGSISQAALLTA